MNRNNSFIDTQQFPFYILDMRKELLLSSLAVLSACSSSQTKLIPNENEVHRELIDYSAETNQKVEFYWAKPGGEGPWPVILYIHGFQTGDNTPGGRDLVDYGVLKEKAEKGIVAVSVSQPGFGASTGSKDFCGSNSQKSVIAVLNEIRSWSFVKPDKIALNGVSRGAIVASMVTAQDQQLAAVILVAGLYDLESSYNSLRSSPSEELRSIAENIKAEAGTTKKDFESRSAIFHSKEMKTPSLIINGKKDPRAGYGSAEKLAELLKKNGTPVRLVIYPQFEHRIPVEERDKEITPFLQKYLF